MKSFMRVAAIAALTLASACAMTPETERRDRLAVQSATMGLIEQSAKPAERAERIADAVSKARTLLDFEEVSVKDIRLAMLTRVAEREPDLSPLERTLALEVVNAVADEVERRLGAGVLTADQRVSVNKVLDWVAQATVFYVPK